MGTMVIADTFGFLSGTWTLTRSIDDRRAGIRGSFRGEATLAGVPGESTAGCGARAAYREDGELQFGAYRGRAGRSLGYERLDEAAVMLYFADGRPFTDLDLRSGAWRGSHLCGADHYEIITVVGSWDEVREHWRVRGPAKDYDASTTLRRAARPGA